ATLVAGRRHYEYMAGLSDPAKIHYPAPGCDSLDTPPQVRGDYLVSATVWKEGKNVEDLIRVVSTIEAAQLKIAGKWLHGDYRRSVEALIADLGVADRIQITDGLTEEELNKIYKDARAAITINEERGIGMPALEAAANACTFLV